MKGPDRVWLKDTLRELEDEGLVERKAKKLVRPGSLPHVVVLDIFGRGTDGELLARPSELPDDGSPAPLVSIRVRRGDAGRAPVVGERVLAKVFPTDDAEGPAYTARILKIIDKRRESVLGVVRILADGSWRLEPVERRQAEYAVDADHRGDAAGWRSGRSRADLVGPLRPAARQGAAIAGQDGRREIRLADCHPCARNPPTYSRRGDRRGRNGPGSTPARAKTGARCR